MTSDEAPANSQTIQPCEPTRDAASFGAAGLAGQVRLDLVISREVARLEWQVEHVEQYVPVSELGDGDRQSIGN